MSENLDYLIEHAKVASEKAYTPYSKFPVGCAIEAVSGEVYTGCNVENISFGLTICAERTAVFKGVSEEGAGFRIKCVVIFTPTEVPITPCGACRQVLHEFGSDFEITSVTKHDKRNVVTLKYLLPQSPDIVL